MICFNSILESSTVFNITCFNHTWYEKAYCKLYTPSKIVHLYRSPTQSPVAVLKLDVLLLKVITESYCSFLYLRRFRQLSHSLGWDDACVWKTTGKPSTSQRTWLHALWYVELQRHCLPWLLHCDFDPSLTMFDASIFIIDTTKFSQLSCAMSG